MKKNFNKVAMKKFLIAVICYFVYVDLAWAGWQIQTVDSGGSVSWWTSIALDSNDNPHISYYDGTNRNLKYAKMDTINFFIISDINTVNAKEIIIEMSKKIGRRFFNILVITSLFSQFIPPLYAEVGISLGWPYIGLKYNFSKQFSTEIKYATGEGINVYGGRFYWNYFQMKN